MDGLKDIGNWADVKPDPVEWNSRAGPSEYGWQSTRRAGRPSDHRRDDHHARGRTGNWRNDSQKRHNKGKKRIKETPIERERKWAVFSCWVRIHHPEFDTEITSLDVLLNLNESNHPQRHTVEIVYSKEFLPQYRAGVIGADGKPRGQVPNSTQVLDNLESTCRFIAAKTQLPECSASVQYSKAPLSWISPHSRFMGHFYINKVFTDKEKQSWLHPSHIENTVTQVVSVEDLLNIPNLQQVLIVNSCWLEEMDMLTIFPPDVTINIVCQSRKNQEIPVQLNAKVCPVHKVVIAEEDNCDCPEARSVSVTHPFFSDNIRCNFVMLRSSHRLRFVLLSDSLRRVRWDWLAQFGWYYDFAVDEQNSSTDDTCPFRSDLTDLLDNLGADHSSLLQNALLSELSPAISLITMHAGAKMNHTVELGLKKLQSLQNQTDWPESTPKNICQTSSLGSGPGSLVVLEDIFVMGRRICVPVTGSEREEIQILYPSHQCVEDAIEDHEELNESHLSYDRRIFKYVDRENIALYYLHEIAGTYRSVIHHAQVYMQTWDTPEGTLGWMVTGSLSPNTLTWAAKKGESAFRYELAIAIMPYRAPGEKNKELKQYAIDLSQIGLHFSSVIPYQPTTLPYLPQSGPSGTAYLHCIGRVYMCNNKYFYLAELEDSDIRNKFRPFPVESDKDPDLGCRKAVLRVDNAIANQIQETIRHGHFIEFIGRLSPQDIKTGSQQFYVLKIVKLFEKIIKLKQALQLEIKDEDLNEPVVKIMTRPDPHVMPEYKWIPADSDGLGHYYINKVYLDQENKNFWQPAHLNGTATKVLSLEELLPTSDLTHVLLVNASWLQDFSASLAHFPSTVDITVVCVAEAIEAAMTALQSLKEEYIEKTGHMWNPETSVPSSGDTDPYQEEDIVLHQKLTDLGNYIRRRKADGATKEEVSSDVTDLLDLKEQYLALTGATWKAGCVPPSQIIQLACRVSQQEALCNTLAAAQEDSQSSHSIRVCPAHPNSSTKDVTCDCAEARRVRVIHPHCSGGISCNFVMLKYSQHTRFVLLSDGLVPVIWERVAQFGWYNDFPLKADNSEASSLSEPEISEHPSRRGNDFEETLRKMLEVLGVKADVWLDNLDFTSLSPCIHLITQYPGSPSSKDQLMKLLGSVPWPATQPKNVIQTTNVGFQNGIKIMDDIFGLRLPLLQMALTDQHTIQIVYPSKQQVEEVMEHQSSLTYDHLGSGRRVFRYYAPERCNDIVFLLSESTDRSVILHANVYRQSWEVSGGERGGMLGWLYTGSQSISQPGWVQVPRFSRYELGLLLLPTSHATHSGRCIDAVDLSGVGLHFCSLLPYDLRTIPYIPHDMKAGFYHTIGQIKRTDKRSKLMFVDEITDKNIKKKFDLYPSDATNLHGAGSAAVTPGLFRKIKKEPREGYYIEFNGREGHAHPKKYRVVKIIKLYKTLSDLKESLGIEEVSPVYRPVLPLAAPKVTRHKKSIPPVPAQVPPELQTEQDFDDYWNDKWDLWYSKIIEKKTFSSAEYDVEKEFPLKPWTMSDDNTWFQNQVMKICNNKEPAWIGPYNPEFIRRSFYADARQHIKGFPVKEGWNL